jgi:hypothetical protein
MKYECPACKRPLASRRHKHCQYCDAELPERMLATPDEIEAESRQRHQEQEARRKRESERDSQNADGGADVTIDF